METSRWDGAQLPQEEDADGGNFLKGLRVLVVDDDQAYVQVLCTQLCSFGFFVALTTYLNQNEGFSFLGENRHEFDVVIASIDMQMGIQFVEFVGQELGLPVIGMCMLKNEKVMEAIKSGACAVLVKPLRKDDLRNIWRQVLWSPKWRPRGNGNKETLQGPERRNGKTNVASLPPNHGKLVRNYRLVWTRDLNKLFQKVVRHLGVKKATPKKILELMNMPGLTRDNISSHLQKYRLLLQKNKAVAESDPEDGKNLKSSRASSPNSKPGIRINEPAPIYTEDTSQRLEPLQMPNLPTLTTTDDRLPQLSFWDMYNQPNFQGAESSDAAMQRERIQDQSSFRFPDKSTDWTLCLSELMITDRGLGISQQLQEKGLPLEPPAPSYGDPPSEHNPSQVHNGSEQMEMESEDLPWDEFSLPDMDDPYKAMLDTMQEIRESSRNWIVPDNRMDDQVTNGTLNVHGNSSTTVAERGQTGLADCFYFHDELLGQGSNWPLERI